MPSTIIAWAWRRTQPLHLLVLGLTASSWFALGAFYGWGFCLCTEWHFQIRRRLGYRDPDHSYIQLLLRKGLGLHLDRTLADTLAVVVFVAIVVATAWAWTR